MAGDIKKTWIVVGADDCPIYGDDDKLKEYRTAKAAVAAAKKHLATANYDEVWVYGLTHVIARPDVEPTVDVIK